MSLRYFTWCICFWTSQSHNSEHSPLQEGAWIKLGIGPGVWWKSHSQLLERFQGEAINNLWVWLGYRQACLWELDMAFCSAHSGQWPVLRREWYSLGLGSWSPAHSCICINKQMMDKPRREATFSSEISLQSAVNSWKHLIKGDRHLEWWSPEIAQRRNLA